MNHLAFPSLIHFEFFTIKQSDTKFSSVCTGKIIIIDQNDINCNSFIFYHSIELDKFYIFTTFTSKNNTKIV